MSLIDNPDSARRLARALMSDLSLYNEEALRRGDDLGEEFAEARALFQSRVAPDHHEVFETALSEFGFNRYCLSASGSAPVPPPDEALAPHHELEHAADRTGVPAGLFADDPPAEKPDRSISPILVILAVVAAIATAIFWLTR